MQKIKIFVILCSLFVLVSCGTVKDCKITPDYERIGQSASENLNNLRETNLRSALASCVF
jgi:hypothetical protein|tara:strand:+ start:121 stop:300 length:180 start_codon:yes stop_codon:yes gene_type:complete